jgi:hypothetical protein
MTAREGRRVDELNRIEGLIPGLVLLVWRRFYSLANEGPRNALYADRESVKVLRGLVRDPKGLTLAGFSSWRSGREGFATWQQPDVPTVPTLRELRIGCEVYGLREELREEHRVKLFVYLGVLSGYDVGAVARMGRCSPSDVVRIRREFAHKDATDARSVIGLIREVCDV